MTSTSVDSVPVAGAPATPTANHLRDAGDSLHRKAREQRRMLARRIRQTALALAIVGAAASTLLALRPRPVPVDAAQVARGALVVAIEESGVTRVKDRYVISAPVTGTLSRLGLESGDAVDEGGILAEIAPARSPLLDERSRAEGEARLAAALSGLGQAKAQAGRALAAKGLAERELDRVRHLVESGSLATQLLDQSGFEARMRAEELTSAVFAGKVATEEVRLARAALTQTGAAPSRGGHVEVLTPAPGSVLRVYQKSAGLVQAGTALVEIGDPAALEVVVDLLTTDAVQVTSGTPVVLQGWGRDQTLGGRVRRIEPSAFTRPSALGIDEQRVNVVISLTDPRETWSVLGDGYRVEARLVLWQASDVLKAPRGAVFRHGDGWAAYQVKDNRARLVPVQIGHRGETEVEIVSGLGPDALLAVHPGDRVKDGVRVEVR